MTHFLEGMGMVLDLGATLEPVVSFDADDAVVLASDWKAVGDVLRQTFEELQAWPII